MIFELHLKTLRDFISKNNQYIYEHIEKWVPLECTGLEKFSEILMTLGFTWAV